MPTSAIAVQAPRSAYVHVPFCAHRCGYCDFTVVAGRGDLVGDYLRAVQLELATQPPAEVDTLYFGGGTPSQLTGDDFERLAHGVLRHWRPAPGFEWTVEANPADVTVDFIDRLSTLGVTRLSLGGQSFDADKLRRLERDHGPDEIARAIGQARDAGIDVCVDLIFAAPGETLDAWRRDLAAAITLRPCHVSTYGLTYERGTAFWTRRLRGELSEVAEDLQRDMYLAAIDDLSAAGFEHYEVSNFAQPGRRSLHNQGYWSGDGYHAVGPGATRFVAGVRETNHRSTTTYLRRTLAGESAVAEREVLSVEQRAREVLVFALRKLEGVDLSGFAAKTGYRVEELGDAAIARYRRQGLLAESDGRLRLTREGLLVSDSLWPDLL
ncbi:MAG: radical SAM family heme chaperone HemW [Planctomycetota bacterium]